MVGYLSNKAFRALKQLYPNTRYELKENHENSRPSCQILISPN